MAKLTKAQMDTLIVKPHRAFLPPGFPVEVEYNNATADQKKAIDKADEQFKQLAKSMLVSSNAKAIGADGKTEVDVPKPKLNTTEVLNLIKNCTTAPLNKDVRTIFDVTRTVSSTYMILWEYGIKRKSKFKRGPIDFSSIFAKNTSNVFTDKTKLEDFFGAKNLHTFAFGTQRGGSVFTTLLMPVYRASNHEQTANDKQAQVVAGSAMLLDKFNGSSTSWQINRSDGERKAYGFPVNTPEWLSYQALCTNTTHIALGPGGPIVKDHNFDYHTWSATLFPEKYRVYQWDFESPVEAPSQITRLREDIDGPAGIALKKMHRGGGDNAVNDNSMNFQTIRHPIAWFNLFTPWNEEGKPDSGKPRAKWFDIQPNKTAQWTSDTESHFKRLPRALQFSNLMHGSMYGENELKFEDGILDKGGLLASLAESLFDPRIKRKPKEEDLDLTNILDYFNGRNLDPTPFNNEKAGLRQRLKSRWFQGDRSHTDTDNEGYLRAALEPIRSFVLDGRAPGSNKGIPRKYQTMFTMVAWMISLFDKGGSGPKLQSVLTEKDFFSTNPTNSPNDFDSYKFLVGLSHQMLMSLSAEAKKAGLKLDDKKKKKKKKGGDAAQAKAARAADQIIINSQCLLLNTINKFASEHMAFSAGLPKKYESIVLTKTGTPSGAAIDADHFLNLIGKRDEVLAQFLNLTPAEVAVLQPRIRLYKQRKEFDIASGKTKDIFKRIIVPTPFETFTNKNNIDDIISNRLGRAYGAGIKEINLIQEGGAKFAKVPTLTDVEIIFYFNRLDEIFLNWPEYKRDPKTNKLDYSKVYYPFGITPGHEKDPPASVAELLFPSGLDPTGLNAELFKNLKTPGFQIMLELGWSVPSGDTPFKTPGRESIVEQLREKTLYKTFFLTPFDSEFDIKENGSVELKVKYTHQGEHIVRDKKNKLFPALFFPEHRYEIKKIVKDRDAKIEKLQRLKASNKKGLKTKKFLNKIDKLEQDIKRLNNKIKNENFSLFLTKSISGLFKSLLGFDPNQDFNSSSTSLYQIYHRILVPREFLIQESPDGGIKKWRPYRELGTIQNFNFQRQNLTWSGRQFKRGGGLTSTGNVFIDATKTASAAAGLLHHSRRSLKGQNRGEALKYKQVAIQQLQALQKQSINMDEAVIPVDFIYFGDFIHAVIEYVKSQIPSGINKHIISADAINLILGSIKVPVVASKGDVKVMDIKITDIPIVTPIITKFIINKIVTAERYDISYIEFIIEFYRFFLNQYFSTLCFRDYKEIVGMSPEIQFFSMYGRKPKGVRPLNPLLKTSKGATCYSKREFKEKMDTYDQQIRTKKHNKNNSFHFCYLGAQTLKEGSYDYKEDLKLNIHHFYIGRSSGLVKRIQFKASDIEGRAEAAWEVARTQLEKAMFLIPRIYDVTVTMIGNHLFEPGQTFFVDPTLGSNLAIGKRKFSSKSIIKSTNLGGYYFISKIESRVKQGMYETIIEGIHLGLGQAKNRTTILQPISQSEIDIENLRLEQEKLKRQAEIQQNKSLWDHYVDYSLK